MSSNIFITSFFFLLVSIMLDEKSNNKLQICCETDENCHQNLRRIMWGVWRRGHSYLNHCEKMTLGNASRSGRAVWSGVWLPMYTIIFLINYFFGTSFSLISLPNYPCLYKEVWTHVIDICTVYSNAVLTVSIIPNPQSPKHAVWKSLLWSYDLPCVAFRGFSPGTWQASVPA